MTSFPTNVMSGAPRTLYIKLRGFGLPNQIVDDSDYKLSKFQRQFTSDSKSDEEIIWYRIISIS